MHMFLARDQLKCNPVPAMCLVEKKIYKIISIIFLNYPLLPVNIHNNFFNLLFTIPFAGLLFLIIIIINHFDKTCQQ